MVQGFASFRKRLFVDEDVEDLVVAGVVQALPLGLLFNKCQDGQGHVHAGLLAEHLLEVDLQCPVRPLLRVSGSYRSAPSRTELWFRQEVCDDGGISEILNILGSPDFSSRLRERWNYLTDRTGEIVAGSLDNLSGDAAGAPERSIS